MGPSKRSVSSAARPSIVKATGCSTKRTALPSLSPSQRARQGARWRKKARASARPIAWTAAAVRERRRSAAGMSHGAAVGEIAGQAVLRWLSGCDPGSRPGITASAVLAAQEAQARLLKLGAQGQAIQALLRTCQACIRRQECQLQLRRLLL